MSIDDIKTLATAVRLMRSRATEAMDVPGERWTVDQSPEHGLVLGAYAPADVADDGWISTSCVAYFAYPGDEENRAHKRAVPVAAHMAGMDPAVALDLADWLDTFRQDLEAAGGVIGSCDCPADVERAVQLARIYLGKESR